MKKKWGSISILLILCLVAGYIVYTHMSSKEQSSNSASIPENYKDMWILVDTSKSMRGYFRTTQSPGTVIQRFLWNGLITILKEQFVEDKIYFSSFSNEINNPQPTSTLLNQFRFNTPQELGNTFRGTETKLIEVFKKLAVSEYVCWAVITDGIPSARDRSGPASEIRRVINSLIEDRNLSLWLVGVRAEFKGKIYPECVNKFGQRVSYDWKGRKPVYIWIGVRDRNNGVEIVNRTLERLRSFSTSQDSAKIEIEFAELSYVDLPSATLSFAESTSDAVFDISKNPPELRILRKSTKQYIEIPLMIHWQNEVLKKRKEIKIEKTPESFPGMSIQHEDENWYLRFDRRRISERILTINLKIKPIVEQWWVEWSTEDDSSPQDANKTLYFKSLLEEFVSQAALKGADREADNEGFFSIANISMRLRPI